MKEDSTEFYARRRKFVNLRKKPKDKALKQVSVIKLDNSSKKAFMRLLTTETITLENLELYNPDWTNWLIGFFNETQTRVLNKVVYYEDIPFYSSQLFKEYEDEFTAITYRVNPFKVQFKKYLLQYTPKEVKVEEISEKVLESIRLKGAFYYILPKKYEWFELEIKGKEILSNIELKLVKTRTLTLPKGVSYWGFADEKSKPYFLNYFSEEEFEKKLKFKTLDRKRLLENNLRERGFVTNFIEGVLVWDIKDIPSKNSKRDILFIPIAGENLFKSFLIKNI